MKGIYKCKITEFSTGWDWEIIIFSGGRNFILAPEFTDFISKSSARRSARRIADKLGIEISFTE